MGRFSLQRVLELREKAEEQKAVALAAANHRVEEARRVVQAMERVGQAERQRFDAAQRGGSRVGDLLGMRQMLAVAERRTLEVRSVVAAAEAEAKERLGELQEASRERRVLERLREKHREMTRLEEGREDGKAMDEIAITRFARATGAAGR